MKLTIINDTHLGVKRQTGTTPNSQKELEDYTLGKFKQLLELADGDLLINGDLFDGYTVSKQVEFATFKMLLSWVNSGNGTLYLSAGNHDLSKDSDKTSSFQNLCKYLLASVASRVKTIGNCFGDEYMVVSEHNAVIIPHVVNQETFNNILDKVLNFSEKYVFVHANFDNNFAKEADHSLNISAEFADRFRLAGKVLVFAHEHNSREFKYEGSSYVLITGNQFPTSVSDCLDKSKAKFYTTLEDGELKLHESEDLSQIFKELDWKDLADFESSKFKFIRVTGVVAQSQSAEIVKAISNFRKKSTAFVITNAAKAVTVNDKLQINLEDTTTSSVHKLLLEHIPEECKHLLEEIMKNVN